jgi:hypothetical protein
MRNKISLYTFSTVLVFLFGCFQTINACISNRNLPSFCEMYGRAGAVFVGKITDIKEIKKENVSSDFEITFQVKEAFLGVKNSTSVSLILWGTTLDYCRFEKDADYLIYASKGDNFFSIDAGTRSRPIQEAEEDLQFLRNLPQQKNGIRIFGNVSQLVKSSLEEDNSAPLPKMFVKLESTSNKQQIFFRKTDAKGLYEFSSVPEDSYNVSLVNVAQNFSTSRNKVTANNKGCVKQNFSVVPTSKIKGRIIDSEGNPVENLTVEVISVNIVNPDYWLGEEFSQTDSKGYFESVNVPPGLYTISVNYNNPPEDNTPFPPTFFPGVLNRLEAQIIQINLGENVENINFQLPTRLTKQAIEGTVLWNDKTPAQGVKVYVKDHLHDVCCINSEVITNEQGHFITYGYKGRKYRVWAVGKRNSLSETSNYGATIPFLLAENTSKQLILLNLTESWLTDMDDDNERTSE